MRIVLTDGASHAVDSSELAFKLAAIYAFRQVELKVPTEFQGTVTGEMNKRKCIIVGNDQEGDDTVVVCHVPLNNTFGYSTALWSMTGEESIGLDSPAMVPQHIINMNRSVDRKDVQMQLVNTYNATKSTELFFLLTEETNFGFILCVSCFYWPDL